MTTWQEHQQIYERQLARELDEILERREIEFAEKELDKELEGEDEEDT